MSNILSFLQYLCCTMLEEKLLNWFLITPRSSFWWFPPWGSTYGVGIKKNYCWLCHRRMFQITATTVLLFEVLLQVCGFLSVSWKLNSSEKVRIHNSYVTQNISSQKSSVCEERCQTKPKTLTWNDLTVNKCQAACGYVLYVHICLHARGKQMSHGWRMFFSPSEQRVISGNSAVLSADVIYMWVQDILVLAWQFVCLQLVTEAACLRQHTQDTVQ